MGRALEISKPFSEATVELFSTQLGPSLLTAPWLRPLSRDYHAPALFWPRKKKPRSKAGLKGLYGETAADRRPQLQPRPMRLRSPATRSPPGKEAARTKEPHTTGFAKHS